eukprot:370995_1
MGEEQLIRGTKIKYNLTKCKPLSGNNKRRRTVDQRPSHLRKRIEEEKEEEKKVMLNHYANDPDLIEISPGIFVLKEEYQKSLQAAKSKEGSSRSRFGRKKD